MDTMNNANVQVNLKEKSANIFGSEMFVERNLQLILGYFERNNFGCEETESANNNSEVAVSTSENGTDGGICESQLRIERYSSVCHFNREDNTISILGTVPGGSKAEKVKNIALIVLYLRDRKVAGSELVPICEKHACYDSSNFASTLSAEKTNFIKIGKGKEWYLELTQPGEVAAKALLEGMLNDKK